MFVCALTHVRSNVVAEFARETTRSKFGSDCQFRAKRRNLNPDRRVRWSMAVVNSLALLLDVKRTVMPDRFLADICPLHRYVLHIFSFLHLI